MVADEVETLVVGAGQAGCAVALELARRGSEHVVLEAADGVGGGWRERWDSLRLFTPAGWSHLPGEPFPAPRGHAASTQEVVAYLADLARRRQVPVALGQRVRSVRPCEPDRSGARFEVVADTGAWRARNVIVTSGAHRRTRVPEHLADLDPDVVQLDTTTYRRPAQVPPGVVLVVGAGNSGAEIALDLARGPGRRSVLLAGRDVGHVPHLGSLTYPLLQAAGRPGAALARRGLRGGGDPLGRLRPGELESAGVRRVPRVVAVTGGRPVTADGERVRADAVVWCTPTTADHRFMPAEVLDASGAVRHRRGLTDLPGLALVGLPYQSAITSHLLGGVGRDAARVLAQLGA